MTPLPHEMPSTGRAAMLVDMLAGAVPVIETARTRLRIPALADLPAWYAIFCTERSRYMDGPCSREDAFRDFAASTGSWLLRGYGACAVDDLATGVVIGFACLNMGPSDREPELGYFILPEAEGQGLALDAVAALRDWARGQGLPALVSYVDPANARSVRLAERLGAHRDPVAEAAFDGTSDAGVAVFRHWGVSGT